MGTSNARNRPFPARIRTLQFILLVLVSIISFGALVFPQVIRPGISEVQLGEVSPSDFQSPETDSYISEVKTENQRDAAEMAVQPVYGLPDPAVARRQIERLRAALLLHHRPVGKREHDLRTLRRQGAHSFSLPCCENDTLHTYSSSYNI